MFHSLFKKKNNEKQNEKKSETQSSIDTSNIPKHVAIIMDGNGRWAKKYGLPRGVGHRKGADVLRNIVIAANDMGIQALTVYGFSTENWKRPEKEVRLLMNLIREYLDKNVLAMHKNNVRIRFLGDVLGLSVELQEIMRDAETLTAHNTGLTLQLAINYGGRAELTQAVKHIGRDLIANKIDINDVTESLIGTYLYTQEFVDVDLLIRPSNDYRISNFLLWQLAYAEFWFTVKHWPEFTPETLVEAVIAYQQRERRFGGLTDEVNV